jgi:hypothetical protein
MANSQPTERHGGPGDKNDEGYLIAELAEPLPTHLSIIKTMLVLQSEPVGSDEENVVRFKELLSVGKITNQFVFNIVAACCDFYAFGWMGTPDRGRSPISAFPRRAARNFLSGGLRSRIRKEFSHCRIRTRG